MKHKMIHYKGYFLAALVFISVGAVVGINEQGTAMPFFAVGFVFWAIGCVKVAGRNATLKANRNL